MKSISSYGRAPPRSMRSILISKGYSDYGRGYKDRADALKVVKELHEEGYLARVVRLSNPMTADYGRPYFVMYRRKK